MIHITIESVGSADYFKIKKYPAEFFDSKPKAFELSRGFGNEDNNRITVTARNINTAEFLFTNVPVEEIEVDGVVYGNYEDLSAALTPILFKKGGGSGGGGTFNGITTEDSDVVIFTGNGTEQSPLNIEIVGLDFIEKPFSSVIDLTTNYFMTSNTLTGLVSFTKSSSSTFGKMAFAKLTGGSISFSSDFVKVNDVNYNASKNNIITFWKEYDKIKYIIETSVIVIPLTTPTNLSSSNISDSSFTLSYSASTGGTAPLSYDIYVNGVFKLNTNLLSASINGLTANTTYTITVRAKDSLSEESAESLPLSITTIESQYTEAIIQQTYDSVYNSSGYGSIFEQGPYTPGSFAAATTNTKVVEVTINGSGNMHLYRWSTPGEAIFLRTVNFPTPDGIHTVNNLNLNLPAGNRLSISGADGNAKLANTSGSGTGTFVSGTLNTSYIMNIGYKTGLPAYRGVFDVSKFSTTGFISDSDITPIYVNQYGINTTQKTVTEIYIKGSGDFEFYSVINNLNPVLLGTVNSPNIGVENTLAVNFILPANARLGVKRKLISTSVGFATVQNDILAYKIGVGVLNYHIQYGYKVI